MTKALGGSGQVLLLAGYSIAAGITRALVRQEAETQDDTGLAAAGVRSLLQTLRNDAMEFDGWFDSAAASAYKRFEAEVGSGDDVVTFVPRSDAVGEWAACAHNLEAMGVRAPTRVGELARLETVLAVSDRVRWGKILHLLTAETATGNGTSVDNTASSANGGRAFLHVTAFSGFTNITVKVQDSPDNAVWTDRITFTAATGITAESLAQTGTVARYLRATWTFTGAGPGSCTFHVVYARD